ncbi:cytochrome P450 [Streptomyces sp. NPDC102274]|uniref:cytochrome P450 n=1 Tax=Streptomyces sp. NPDC102274 TaxID=3366151 RepID=UPI00382A67C4
MTEQRFALAPFERDARYEADRLRSIGPVVAVSLPGGIPAHAITQNELLHPLLLNSKVSPDHRRYWSLWPQVARRPDWVWILGWIGGSNLQARLGPDKNKQTFRRVGISSHTVRRRAEERLRPRAEAAISTLLDSFADRPATKIVDLRADYAMPLSLETTCDLFGATGRIRRDIGALAARVMDTTAVTETAGTTTLMHTVVADLIAHKRARPGDDLTTDLITMRGVDGNRLSSEERSQAVLWTLVASLESTIHLVGNTLHALLSRPWLLAEGNALADQRLEEALSWSPSVSATPLLYAVDDVELGDVTVRAGEAILTTLASGTAYEVAQASRIEGHIAFGANVHQRISVPLARLQAGLAMRALLARFPGVQPAPTPLAGHPSLAANGWATAPVCLSTSVPAQSIPRFKPRQNLTPEQHAQLRDFAVSAYDGGKGMTIRQIAAVTGRAGSGIQRLVAEEGTDRRRKRARVPNSAPGRVKPHTP